MSKRDLCGGLQTDTINKGYCNQLIRQQPETFCERAFTFTQSQQPACKEFCSIHRLCFFPLPDGNRCNNLRAAVGNGFSKYCAQHKKHERQCGKLVSKYHSICGKDPHKRNRCVIGDDVSVLEQKEMLLKNCFEARLLHDKQCIHEEARDAGHVAFLGLLQNRANFCHNTLWHEAPQWDADDYDSDDSDYTGDSDNYDDNEEYFDAFE